MWIEITISLKLDTDEHYTFYWRLLELIIVAALLLQRIPYARMCAEILLLRGCFRNESIFSFDHTSLSQATLGMCCAKGLLPSALSK